MINRNTDIQNQMIYSQEHITLYRNTASTAPYTKNQIQTMAATLQRDDYSHYDIAKGNKLQKICLK